MKIAEVVSRFSDIDGFIDLVESLGFDFMEKVNDGVFSTGLWRFYSLSLSL